MLQNNPNVNAVTNLIKQYGDPQSAFYAEAKRRGVNPEDVLSMLQ